MGLVHTHDGQTCEASRRTSHWRAKKGEARDNKRQLRAHQQPHDTQWKTRTKAAIEYFCKQVLTCSALSTACIAPLLHAESQTGARTMYQAACLPVRGLCRTFSSCQRRGLALQAAVAAAAHTPQFVPAQPVAVRDAYRASAPPVAATSASCHSIRRLSTSQEPPSSSGVRLPVQAVPCVRVTDSTPGGNTSAILDGQVAQGYTARAWILRVLFLVSYCRAVVLRVALWCVLVSVCCLWLVSVLLCAVVK